VGKPAAMRVRLQVFGEVLGAGGPGGHAEGGELAVSGVEEWSRLRSVSPAEMHAPLVEVTRRQQGQGP
jgi:hypothetical protein